MAGLVIATELAQRGLVQVGQNVAQFLGWGITGRESRSVDLAQRADEGVAVLVADFAILVAVAIVETCLAHTALPGAHGRQHPPAATKWQRVRAHDATAAFSGNNRPKMAGRVFALHSAAKPTRRAPGGMALRIAPGSDPRRDRRYFLNKPMMISRITAPMTALTMAARMPPTRTNPIIGSSQPAMMAPMMPTTILPTSPRP